MLLRLLYTMMYRMFRPKFLLQASLHALPHVLQGRLRRQGAQVAEVGVAHAIPQELVEGNGYEIAWSREDAVSKVLEEIEVLSIEDGDDDDELLIEMAKMLIQIAQGRGWDNIIERNTPYDYGATADFDL